MKVGLSAIITPREWSFAETVQNAGKAGYEALEVLITDEGDLTMSTSEADCQKLAAVAADEGIELASVCASVREQPKDLITNDDAVRAASIETVKRCLATTRAMGVDTMLLTIGALNDDLYYNEAYANALKSLQLIAPVAEDLGVNSP